MLWILAGVETDSNTFGSGNIAEIMLTKKEHNSIIEKIYTVYFYNSIFLLTNVAKNSLPEGAGVLCVWGNIFPQKRCFHIPTN